MDFLSLVGLFLGFLAEGLSFLASSLVTVAVVVMVVVVLSRDS